eukprot:scaffold143773_cov133-Phaeocystis_antarctica.AAC.3
MPPAAGSDCSGWKESNVYAINLTSVSSRSEPMRSWTNAGITFGPTRCAGGAAPLQAHRTSYHPPPPCTMRVRSPPTKGTAMCSYTLAAGSCGRSRTRWSRPARSA